MQYNFDTRIDRRSTESIKWHFFDPDVLPMWVADMDFASPEPVVQALKARVEHGVFGYPQELPDLRPVVLAHLEKHFNWQVDPDDLIFLPGVITGFNLACHMLPDPHSGVLVQTPLYPPMLKAAENTGRTAQEMELSRQEDGSYAIDWMAFENAITEQTRLFILCNPHNPVGRVFRQDELERMAEICLRHKMLICSDEIHCDLTYTGHPHIPVASLDAEIAQHTITLIAPSKTFNIAGLESSVAIISNPELRERFLAARRGLVGWVNLMGQIAMRTAYQQGQEWLDQLLVYLQANRDYLMEYVQANLPGVHMGLTEGTYLAWLDCRAIATSGSPCEFFIEKARVGLNDGATFGSGGEGFVRLNFGCPRSMLQEALERMRQTLLEI